MKILIKSVLYVFTAATVLMLMAACSGTADIGEAPPETVCRSLVDAKCVTCHYKTRICDALGTKSVSKWKRSINFMINRGRNYPTMNRTR